ncbi:AraC family transcriptional regulator ligand-binding domain-containing protein [Aquirhabdus sp.]|uniref:AraC family transcriptional regulator n=1 Tax=Aquirhabdus sp. TaxID=2824160 RepID=UPI00396CBEFE
MDLFKQRDMLQTSLAATYASYMLRLAESRGIKAEQLLAHTDLIASTLLQPQARIFAWQQAIIVHNLLKLTHDPSLAIEIGLRSNLTKAGFIGYGLMSCATLRDAIELGTRFLPTQVPFFKLGFDIQDEMAVVTVEEAFPLWHFRTFAIENFLIEVSEIFRSLLVGQYAPGKYQQLQLYFDYPEPDYFAAYKDRLPKLYFNQAANQFRFSAHMLDQSISTANPAMAQLVISQGESELARLGLTENWLDRVRALLECQAGQYPDLPSIAAQLHLSERTFKRKLAEQNLSFSELLESVMLRDAYALLQSSALSIDEVSQRLGYQDRSNFTRAFKRWTGQTPSEYRTTL